MTLRTMTSMKQPSSMIVVYGLCYHQNSSFSIFFSLLWIPAHSSWGGGSLPPVLLILIYEHMFSFHNLSIQTSDFLEASRLLLVQKK